MMLETVHEFAREKLEESGEAEEIKRAHAAVFPYSSRGGPPRAHRSKSA